MSSSDHSLRRSKKQRAELAECATAFAAAVKNLTIYPATHPRVLARASEFADKFKASASGACELVFANGQLLLEGEELPIDNLAVAWLAQRGRDVGLHGVLLEPNCTADDVTMFAAALICCRPGSGQNLLDSWQHDTARVRPIELLVEDHHARDGAVRPGELPPAMAETAPLDHLGEGLEDKLASVADRPEVRELLSMIEAASRDEEAESLDLLGTIGELLPVDAPNDVDELASTVENILARVNAELRRLMRNGSRVRGAELLRSAVGIARSYFRRSNPPQQQKKDLPSGRPEDARIVADLEALLMEYNNLPDHPDLHLPPGSELDTESPALGHELLGIYLYGLAVDNDEYHRRTRIELVTRLVASLPTAQTDLLDTYLLTTPDGATLPASVRVALLYSFEQAGLVELIRERQFLSEELITGGFPDTLPLAARVLNGSDQADMLRRALAAIGPILDHGGSDAAEASGHLNDSTVIHLLTQIGGDQALRLLSLTKSSDEGAKEALHAFAMQLPLPEREAAALRAVPVAATPPSYLRRVLRAAAQDRFDGVMRQATGDLLREFVVARRTDWGLAALLRAIDALRYSPSLETTTVLRRTAAAGRFLNFTRSARAVRRQAREALAALSKQI